MGVRVDGSDCSDWSLALGGRREVRDQVGLLRRVGISIWLLLEAFLGSCCSEPRDVEENSL